MLDSIQTMIDGSGGHLLPLSEKVQGQRILIGGRYAPGIPVMGVYGVLAYYLGTFLQKLGAKVDFYNTWQNSGKCSGKYDIGILCHYDTDYIVQSRDREIIQRFIACTKRRFYYTNVVPALDGFERYLLSRQCYLSPDDPVYKRREYPSKRRPFQKAVWVGRAADCEILRPKQDPENWYVIVDAAFESAQHMLEGQQIATALERAKVKVQRIGFNRSRKEQKRPFFDVVPIYNGSSVYICPNVGLYELPVIEAQMAGNYVVSYKNVLHKELLRPGETTWVCNTPDEVVDMVLKRPTDSWLPRSWAYGEFQWKDVLQRIAAVL